MGSAITRPNLTPLEAPRTFTPLGIRFWDAVLDRQVESGLVVRAQLRDGNAPPVEAFRTRSGVYAFQGLPGLRDVEFPVTGTGVLASPPVSLPFLVGVADTLGRYLPTVFRVDLPLPYRGVFPQFTAGSPPGASGRFYLFSTPSRAVPAGIAAVRADLQDRDTGQGAAFAVLRAEVNGSTGIGMADERGSVLVLFPFPVVERLRAGSPPGMGSGPVTGYTRPVTVTAQYQPAALTFPLANKPGVPDFLQNTPSLKSILHAQTDATLWQTDAGPATGSLVADLTFGEELILATAAGSPSQMSSSLLISRGASPL